MPHDTPHAEACPGAGLSMGGIMGHFGALTCYSITYISALIRKEKAIAMRYIISLLLTSVAAPAMAEVPRVVTDIPPGECR